MFKNLLALSEKELEKLKSLSELDIRLSALENLDSNFKREGVDIRYLNYYEYGITKGFSCDDIVYLINKVGQSYYRFVMVIDAMTE